MYPTVMTISTTIRPTANGMSPFRQIGELEEKGRAARDANQQQSDREWFVQAEHSGKPDGGNRRQHEIREQGQHDEPDVSQRRKNLRDGQSQPDRQRARDDEHHDRRIRAANQQVGQWHGVRATRPLKYRRLTRASPGHRRPENGAPESPAERSRRRPSRS